MATPWQTVKNAAKWTYENTPILGEKTFDGAGVRIPGIGGAIASLFDTPEEQPQPVDQPYPELYYSGCDVGIFIGDRWVYDIITIQYTLTNNKSPIYGYMSEEFDAVAKGTKVVQGQFAIAFKDVDYLNRILDNYKGTSEFITTTSSKESDEQVSTKRFPTTPDEYGYKSSSFGDYINVEGFSIIVTFGDTTGYWRGGTYEILDNIHITSRSLVCEPTGEPIAEIYSFFARRINRKPLKTIGLGDTNIYPKEEKEAIYPKEKPDINIRKKDDVFLKTRHLMEDDFNDVKMDYGSAIYEYKKEPTLVNEMTLNKTHIKLKKTEAEYNYAKGKLKLNNIMDNIERKETDWNLFRF